MQACTVVEGYIDFVRPLLKPQCNFVLVTRNGGQHSKLGDVMSKLVFDTIGKFIQILSQDQKHSSSVAKIHYQKQRSLEVAVKAHKCLQRLQGTKGSEVDREVHTRFSGSSLGLSARVETAESKNGAPKGDPPPTNQLRVQRHSRRVLKFTADEDDFLKKGIGRYGSFEGCRFQISRRKNGGLSQEKGWNENAASLTRGLETD